MTYLIVGIAVLIFVVFFWWWGKQPPKHRITVAHGDFRKYLEALLYRGYNGGFLIIETPDRKRFIQFSKYIEGRKHVGLQFDFPLAPWSTEYFEQLQNLLSQQDYDYEIQEIDPGEMRKFDSQVSKFIVVDLDQNLEAASELIKLILLEVFKLSPIDTATLFFFNISLREEKIGF